MFTHICTNFTSNAVHAELIAGMAEGSSERSLVFVPCKSRSLFGKHDPGLPNVAVKYFLVPAFLRYFQLLKAAYSFCFILLFVRRHGVDLKSSKILAHTFWSDGVLAYLLHKLYGCEYVLAVRNTDINVFFRYGYHLRPLMRRIGAAAQAIVSPNVSYLERVRDLSWLRIRPEKLRFIPNPLSAWWYDRMQELEKEEERGGLQGCFVGDFTPNKNVASVIQAFARLRHSGLPLRLVCVGGTPAQLRALCNVDALPEWVEVRGRIRDKTELARVYRTSRFLIVPSFRETFGMVYLEALSQGCMVIYSKGQGIDGALDGAGFQFAVNPGCVDDIVAGIRAALASDYVGAVPDRAQLLQRFRTEAVVDEYRKLASS